jgi:transposase
LHLLCEQRCRPLSLVLSAGQVHDSRMLSAVLDAVRVPRLGKGRPRQRPVQTLADKGYSYARCRTSLRKRGIAVVIPERKDERERRQKKGRAGGRPCRFDREGYRGRNVVERTILRLKQWRRIATRYDKLGSTYLAWSTLASLLLWLN